MDHLDSSGDVLGEPSSLSLEAGQPRSVPDMAERMRSTVTADDKLETASQGPARSACRHSKSCRGTCAATRSHAGQW
eukprot:706588-Rhodomonas_salina.1